MSVILDFLSRFSDEICRNEELSRILQAVVEVGLRGGWAEFEDTPLQLPRIQLAPPRPAPPPSSDDSSNTPTDSNRSTPNS